MPFAEHQRFFCADHDRQRCQRTPVAHRSGKMAGVVLAFDRPTKSEAATGKSGERELKICVDPLAKGIKCRRGQRHSRRDELLAVGFAPVFEWGRWLGHMGSFMISKELRNLLAALALAVAPLAAAAANDDAVLGAYDAYRAGDALKFARFAKKLEGHLLDPWIDYWRIAMRLEDTPTKEVQAFFEEHANTYVAEVLRGDWLKVLGKRGDWPEFERQLALYPREDLEVRCYAWLMALGRGEPTTLADADWMWLGPPELLESRLVSGLTEADVRYLWGSIGYEAAREHHPDALKWYARAGKQLDEDQLAWKVRAALRLARWDVVRETIDLMPTSTRHESAWTYWYGRALAAQGEETGSRAYYLRIAGNTDFYGLLAAEELGYVSTLPESIYVPTEGEVDAARQEPGLARALEPIRLGMRNEGVREWLFSIRYFEDAKLLAASEFARRAGIWDRSIQAADRTVRTHNFALRYPLPFREVFTEYAKTYDLDEAWILGLVRQESRFISDARSSAGAAGLMQVMPRTARFVAQKIGLRNYLRKGVTEVETNITLGTGYLRLVLDQLGHPLLASAAYNAGPARARRWRDASRPLEGAIYAETIPFPDTRDYVKKVMANSVFYAALIDKQVSPLKARLGTITPRGGGPEPVDDDLQ